MNIPEPVDPLEGRTGTLSDADIRELAQKHRLITKGFADESLKQACYELRASDVFYRPPDREPSTVAAGERIIIRPKELVVIIVMETVALPDDMMGRILTKGQLFSLGLSSVNTYADPGFEGQLGIVFYNTSTKYIAITPGVPIAKMEFSKLERSVAKPYKGQHGYQTKLWPILTEYYLKDEQIRDLRRNRKLESSLEALERAYGPDFGLIATKLVKWYRLLFLSMLTYMLCTIVLVVLNVGDVLKSQLLNLAVGVVASVIASVLILFATSRR